jgi:hypothetical protein
MVVVQRATSSSKLPLNRMRRQRKVMCPPYPDMMQLQVLDASTVDLTSACPSSPPQPLAFPLPARARRLNRRRCDGMAMAGSDG